MDLGHLGCQEGGRRRTQTRNDTKKTAQGSEMGSLLACVWMLEASFCSMCFHVFSAPLFIARFAVWGDFGRCFGRHLGSLGPLKIMPKCTTICIFRVWALFVRSLFPELLLEGVWHAFSEIFVPNGAPIGNAFGHFWQAFQGLILQSVLGRQKGVKSWRNRRAGGRGGAAKLALAVQELGSTRLAPSRRDGAGDIYICASPCDSYIGIYLYIHMYPYIYSVSTVWLRQFCVSCSDCQIHPP